MHDQETTITDACICRHCGGVEDASPRRRRRVEGPDHRGRHGSCSQGFPQRVEVRVRRRPGSKCHLCSPNRARMHHLLVLAGEERATQHVQGVPLSAAPVVLWPGKLVPEDAERDHMLQGTLETLLLWRSPPKLLL